MGYQYKLIISNQSLYKEFEIFPDMERVKVGTTPQCELRMNPEAFFCDMEILLEKKEQWSLSCGDKLYISRGDIRKLLFTNLVHGDTLSLCYAESGEVACKLHFLIDFEAETPRYEWKLDLSRYDKIEISDREGADIQLESEFGKDTYVQLLKSGADYVIREQKSQFGTYINGKKISGDVVLEDHDFLSVADFSAYYSGGTLYFSHKNIRTHRIEKEADTLSFNTTYPMFVRNTRVKSQYDETDIKILDPASIPTKPELNIATSLMPTIAMFALVVVLRGIMNTSGGSFVLFSICSMGLGVITSIVSIFDRKKKYKKACQDRRTVYEAYVEKKKQEIQEARRRELLCMRETYYSTQEDLEHIEKFDSCLFDRVPEDEDYLDVYLGVGTTEARQKVDYKAQERLEVGDDLCQIPGELSEAYQFLQEAPVVVSLRQANAIGVVGDTLQQYDMMKVILTDLISRQYYGDLNIYTILGDDFPRYDWLRELPHIQGAARQRNIVCDSESKNNIFENLYKELTNRGKTKVQVGFNVVFVMAEQGIKSHPISKFVEKASTLNTVFIFFEECQERLPLYCTQIIHLTEANRGYLFATEDKTEQKEFTYIHIPDTRLKNAIHILAPVYCEEISLESALRKSISLFELLGIYSVGDIDLGSNWRQSKVYDTMAVPLGVNAKEEVVYLNLHEKFHGPHGLVAGTTGSGKSEILQTFILGAATLFHPYDIGFVIIDFKGGGMVNQFKNLPHLMGAITNIDGKAIDRSLKSIKAELLKRQELFAEAEVNHIDKYIKAYKEGKVKTALPHLVIIVDEFAELKAEQPEFMKQLISAARIGRSLGVHLILATQKPAGQVNDQIWSNSKFKLCLKVQTQEDSNEVLKSPLAAEIREPGRAYLQVGNNEVFELLQSGFSGSPEKSDGNNLKSFDICTLDFKGNRKLLYRQRPRKNGSSRTQLEAVVDYVDDYCKKQHIAHLPEICLPALSERIVCDGEKYPCPRDIGFTTPIGIYDDPDHQYQGVATIPAGSDNTLIVGSAQYGKTNLLETIVRNLAEAYSPRELNLYIIDFASMVLKNFEKLSHVGGVVCPSDDEKLKNLFKYLTDQITARREKMLAVGVSSFASYKEAGHQDLPQIVVLIDNMTALRELYLQDNDVLLNLCREGTSVGISFIIANSQTNGMGYKYLANFATRIALFCNESGEYTTVFNSCRMRPDETPGRCLIEIDKTIFECQSFLAFEGEREIERVGAMQKFVEQINEKYRAVRAVPIPEIPELLGEKQFLQNYGTQLPAEKVLLGLSYDTVLPVSADMLKGNLMAISGADGSGKANFIRYLVHTFREKSLEFDLYIFDDYKKKLSGLVSASENTRYMVGTEGIGDVLTNLEIQLQGAYQNLISGDPVDPRWRILVLNNEDVVNTISSDKAALAAFKNLIGKYKMLNVYVIIGSVPNAQIVYGAPEVYKIVKDTRNILFFDNLDNCKLVDIPLAVVRSNRKKLAVGDAYYIAGNDCYKLKTPYAVN